MASKNRISILTKSEVEDLYSRPIFNSYERQCYFSLEKKSFDIINQCRTLKSKVFFVLNLGYFKAKKQFFKFSAGDVKEDIEYIVNEYFKDSYGSVRGELYKDTFYQQKTEILNLCGFSNWNKEIKDKASNHLSKLIRLYPKGNDTLREFFVFLESIKAITPPYRTIQNMFTEAYRAEKDRIENIYLSIPALAKEKISGFIKNEEGITQLNIVKNDQKDFKLKSIRREISKLKEIRELYNDTLVIIPNLEISNNAIMYYSEVVGQYPAARIRKLSKSQQFLHITCFINQRYKELIDNLITSFIFHIRSILDDAKDYAKHQEEEHVKSITQNFPNLVEFLRWFSAGNIDPKSTYEEFSKVGFDILPQDKQSAIADFIAGKSFDRKQAQWNFFEKSFRRITLYLRSIILEVDFESHSKKSLITTLLDILKVYLSSYNRLETISLDKEVASKIPSKVLNLLEYNVDENEVNSKKFEFYIYEKLFGQIDTGRMFCNSSITYCSLDYDLVSDELVDNAYEIASELGYNKIPVYCDSRLDEALDDLDEILIETNDNIVSGRNKSVLLETSVTGEPKLKLLYENETQDDLSFFDILEQIDIADILKIIGDSISLWLRFSPLKTRYTKEKAPSALILIACILADAFGFGIKKMSEMSNVSYNSLRTVDENFMYSANLYSANDIVSDYIHALPVSKTWYLKDNLVIADADGQKFETSHHTIQSRYSSKYFGTCKGISVYSLVANHIPVNSKIIGPNEHESHHLYDLLFDNNTNLNIDMVTGDNHSINQANFVALDSINIAFIPGIKDIKSELENIYSANNIDDYSGPIKPIGKINKDKIKQESRGIIRILLSLLLQKNTQAVIIKKLSSHKRYSKLRDALWEYNKIFKSIHILNIINDMHLRKSIKSSRNRTESYHQLQSTIRRIYTGAFKGRKIVSNAVSNQASRLVANCIIAYNATLLNQVYEILIAKVGEKSASALISKISPVAWQHIIFTGRYNFKDLHKKHKLDQFVQILVERMTDTSCLSK